MRINVTTGLLTESGGGLHIRLQSLLAALILSVTAISSNARAQLLDSYNADSLALGSVNTWHDLTGTQNANTIASSNDPTAANTNATFYGHKYVSFASNSGLMTSSALFSGGGDRTVVAVYDTPIGDNGGVNPIVGESGPGVTGTWFVLQARTSPPGNPYLAGFFDDASGGTTPVANQLTFAVATYSNSGSLESIYWAYGLTGSVSAASNPTTLNTVANPFTIGYDQGGETSLGNMQIGQVLVYGNSVDGAGAGALISGLQAYYTPVVPEPSSWALTAAGVALLGFCLRRKSALLK